MEKRQSLRMNLPVPMKYRLHISEPSEKVRIGEGVLKNLSQGGVFFTCEDPLSFAIGNTGIFTIIIISPSLDSPESSHIVFTGLVKRIELPTEGATGFGVAVQLLSPLEVVAKDLPPLAAPTNSTG
ncbi:MAG: PilZ domain-containing protein [Deltaproteobacteria bacterium]|nr:PilZ domain-containing protein [Deltaproteobacteria bacterium]